MNDLIQFSLKNEKIIRLYKTAYTHSNFQYLISFFKSIPNPVIKQNIFLTEHEHNLIIAYINSFTTECDISLYNTAIFQALYDLTCYNFLAFKVLKGEIIFKEINNFEILHELAHHVLEEMNDYQTKLSKKGPKCVAIIVEELISLSHKMEKAALAAKRKVFDYETQKKREHQEDQNDIETLVAHIKMVEKYEGTVLKSINQNDFKEICLWSSGFCGGITIDTALELALNPPVKKGESKPFSFHKNIFLFQFYQPIFIRHAVKRSIEMDWNFKMIKESIMILFNQQPVSSIEILLHEKRGTEFSRFHSLRISKVELNSQQTLYRFMDPNTEEFEFCSLDNLFDFFAEYATSKDFLKSFSSVSLKNMDPIIEKIQEELAPLISLDFFKALNRRIEFLYRFPLNSSEPSKFIIPKNFTSHPTKLPIISSTTEATLTQRKATLSKHQGSRQ